MPVPAEPDTPTTAPPGVHPWRHPAILGAAAMSMAAGFAQFSATSGLPDVAAAFGEVGNGVGVAGQIGLSATTLGLGQAVIRLSSLASLPLSGAADRVGRRRMLLLCSAGGLAMVSAAALSQSFVWFVVLFSLARAPLSSTNALAGVIAAEETQTRDRAKAIALITVGYGFGAGLTGIVRAVGGEAIGFRALFGLSLIPLLLLPLLARTIEEPERFRLVRERSRALGLRARSRLALAPFEPASRRRFVIVGVLTFAIAFASGPINTNLFVFAESVLGLPRSATAIAVLAAGPSGLVGLVLGRWAADRLGRRLTAGLGHTAIALAGMLTYSAAGPALLTGYLLTIFAGGMYAPAAGAIAAELFPTRMRATVAGWVTVAGVLGATVGLIVFGAMADALGGFARAAVAVCAPVLAVAFLYALLPETRGLELEQSAPEE